MKNSIERIKKQYKDEALKTFLVIIGAVGGSFAIKGIRKLTADSPTIDAIAEYGLPILFAGSGFLIAAATEPNSKAKYFGYGLVAAGGIEGIKIIPAAKEYLSGLGETEIPAASAYYTESEERQKLMSGFGLASLPVGNVMMQEASAMDTNLPELEGAEERESEDLGYNGEATSEADLNGIL